jgi:hypothetical protein
MATITRGFWQKGSALIAAVIAMATVTPASAQAQMTPEQQQQLEAVKKQMLERYQQIFSGQMGALTGMPSVPSNTSGTVAQVPQAVAPVSQMTEPVLNRQLEAFPPLAGGAAFERFKDGFAANGKRFIDPEGKIVIYGFDTMTGDATYVAQVDAANFVIKTTRVLVDAEPVTIATATRTGVTWQVVTATGKKLSGDRLLPLSRGFLVARESTGFKYIAGQGISSFAVPDSFEIASFQNGDIGGTGYVLIAKIPSARKQDTFGEMIETVKALGDLLGAGKAEDYKLYNILTGQAIPINVALKSNEIAAHSRCRQVNRLVADCARVDFFDSLFDEYGMPNYGHYFWRISWYKTATRPLLIAQEGGLSTITATDISTGTKVKLFERTLGINGFSVRQFPSGQIAVTASLGFDKQTIDDVEKRFSAAQASAADFTQASTSQNSAPTAQ